MHVDDYDTGLVFDLVNDPISRLERTIDGLHVRPTLEIDHSDFPFFSQIVNNETAPRILPRVVQGPEDPPLPCEKFLTFPSIPQVITRRDNVDTEVEHDFRIFFRDPFAVSEIFPVCDAEVEFVLLDVLLQDSGDKLEAWVADDVADEQYVKKVVRQNLVKSSEVRRNS